MPSSTKEPTRLPELPCGLCRGASLLPAYKPEGGRRGLAVYVCADCGLVQSLPRIDRAPREDANVTQAADWGNLRYGKAFRTQTAICALRAHLPSRAGVQALDVGANRGAFAEAFLETWPGAEILAVEPDTRVVDGYAEREGLSLVRARIEDTQIPPRSMDLVHSCHTIEHLADPLRTLEDHWRVLRPGGVLYVDAPNLDVIGSDDILEEFFIDKHLYHFSEETLSAMIERAGFEIRERVTPSDATNLVFIARKARGSRHSAPPPGEALRAARMISAYAEQRAQNKRALAALSEHLLEMGPERIAIWGAGRLFRALLAANRLDASAFACIVDRYLAPIARPGDAFEILPPDALSGRAPQYILVMSRAFSAEIDTQARALVPNAEILNFGELLSEARIEPTAPIAATA